MGRRATADEALAFRPAIGQQSCAVNQQPSNPVMLHRSMKEDDGN
jgi:hypothetical protein